jgi:MFS family permease
MTQSYLRAIYLRLAGALMLVIALALGASAYTSHRVFEHRLAPEMAAKVVSGGSSTRAVLLRAMEHSVAFTEIYGIEQSFDELKTAIPDVAYTAVTDASGRIVYSRFNAPPGAADHFRRPEVLAWMDSPQQAAPAVRLGDQYLVSMPIVTAQQQRMGMLHIGVSVDFIKRLTTDMVFDVLVVLVVALFFTLELLHFLAGDKIEKTLRSLGESLERGAAGDFSTARMAADDGAPGAAVRALEAIRQRVSAGYEALAREVDAARRRPAHERAPALDGVRAGMLALARKYRFGNEVEPVERADDGHLSKVRAPLFAFILAEELTRPFLPGYVKDLLVPIPGLTPEIVVGLPIVLFMLIVALGQPWLAAYAERVGNRRAMTTGALVAACGLAASAMAASVLDLLLWRSLCALGYGMVFVAAQAHVLEYSNSRNRARSFAVFIGAIMVATVCGPSIGGILADNIGERATLWVAALLALGSTLAMRLMPETPALDGAPGSARLPRLREFASLLVNRRFMTVTGLAAMPAKILLTGMCFYLVPLFLLSIDSTQAVAGRVLMTYGVVMVLVSPLAAGLATTRQRMEWLVAAGLIVSGAGGVLLLFGDHVLWVFGAVLLVGLGQALSMAAQSALVREHCEREITALGEPAVYGVYRLLERLGNALGPVVAATLVVAVGYRSSFVVTGAAVLVCGLVFLLLTAASQARARATPAIAPVS